jgi:hypothetical protein
MYKKVIKNILRVFPPGIICPDPTEKYNIHYIANYMYIYVRLRSTSSL